MRRRKNDIRLVIHGVRGRSVENRRSHAACDHLRGIGREIASPTWLFLFSFLPSLKGSTLTAPGGGSPIIVPLIFFHNATSSVPPLSTISLGRGSPTFCLQFDSAVEHGLLVGSGVDPDGPTRLSARPNARFPRHLATPIVLPEFIPPPGRTAVQGMEPDVHRAGDRARLDFPERLPPRLRFPLAPPQQRALICHGPG